MTPALLVRLGSLLYGPRWAAELARGLGVSRESVVSWAAGRYAPSAERTEAAKVLVAERIQALRQLQKKL